MNCKVYAFFKAIGETGAMPSMFPVTNRPVLTDTIRPAQAFCLQPMNTDTLWLFLRPTTSVCPVSRLKQMNVAVP